MTSKRWSQTPWRSSTKIYEPNDKEQKIINKDNQYRNEVIIDKTRRYHLRPTRSDWKNRYAGEYSAPVVLSNLWTPKAIRLYGVEAVASILKEIGQLQDKGVWTPIKYNDIEDKSKIIRSLLFLKRK